ncbi:MAG TPA: hypothetical protein VND93_00305 [Myxococcales bacterium]|jgi:hypothetical protein|nr:hypothetical protein [Myxococcales bacterium]
MLAAVLLAAQALAQNQTPPPLNAPPRPDRSPTAWACTVDTLISAKDCLFEATSEAVSDHAAQRAQNVKFARQLAQAACAKAARPAPGTTPDKALLDICEKEFTASAETCSLDGKSVLVDAQGRFSAGAQGCYRALADVLQRSALMGSLASGCCRCMQSRGCRVNTASCYANITRGTPGPAEKSCMTSACADECGEAPASRGKPVEASVPTKKVERSLPAHAL